MCCVCVRGWKIIEWIVSYITPQQFTIIQWAGYSTIHCRGHKYLDVCFKHFVHFIAKQLYNDLDPVCRSSTNDEIYLLSFMNFSHQLYSHFDSYSAKHWEKIVNKIENHSNSPFREYEWEFQNMSRKEKSICGSLPHIRTPTIWTISFIQSQYCNGSLNARCEDMRIVVLNMIFLAYLNFGRNVLEQ